MSIKFVKVVNFKNSSHVVPPILVGYKMWDEDDQKWNKYNSAGDIVPDHPSSDDN